jgi:hypothetical protein
VRAQRSRIALLVALCLATLGGMAYAQVACPKNLSVDQKATAPNDWGVDYSKLPAALSSATIFDGPPAEQASLKYDDQRTTSNSVIQTWALPASVRGYWLVCGYTNTTAQLERKLPNDARTCEVVLEKGVTFGDGGAVIKRARCTSSPAPPPVMH